MDRPFRLCVAALGLLIISAPSIAKHGESRTDPNDRTQDYSGTRYGPSLLFDSTAYFWNEHRHEPVDAPDRSRPDSSFGKQHTYVVSGNVPVVTLVTIMPVTTTTTVVTEEFYYETLRLPIRKKAMRKWKLKPRCACR
ncbi:hypothetical protein [Sphingorhabdus sp.]|uniref:hypothetical protein n=1 Tax=Sphingorhabdus sp. TaxID=1902408 RepID=UPI003918DF3D